MRTYLISFNATRFSGQSHLIEAFFSNHREIKSWISPHQGCYIVKSENEVAQEISDSLDTFFSRNGFIVTGIGVGNKDVAGRAIGEVWKFVNPAWKSD